MNEPHSKEYFGEYRDLWWNSDFLTLMANRLRLSEVKEVLDVGSGLGHWLSVLLPFLHPTAKIIGVDADPIWVREAPDRITALFGKEVSSRVSFIQGDAQDLNLPQESFDLVTCQTLLMHLDRPELALQGMKNALRKNGTILCVEPENLINFFNISSATEDLDPSEVGTLYEFWLRYERGRKSLGKGRNSVGTFIPQLLAETGFESINAHLNDKCFPMYSPYTASHQKTLIAQHLQWRSSASGLWDKKQVQAYALAGGATPTFFEMAWLILEKSHDIYHAQLKKGSLSAAGGGLTYLFSAQKKE